MWDENIKRHRKILFPLSRPKQVINMFNYDVNWPNRWERLASQITQYSNDSRIRWFFIYLTSTDVYYTHNFHGEGRCVNVVHILVHTKVIIQSATAPSLSQTWAKDPGILSDRILKYMFRLPGTRGMIANCRTNLLVSSDREPVSVLTRWGGLLTLTKTTPPEGNDRWKHAALSDVIDIN